MSAILTRIEAIENFTPAADYTGKEGYTVTLAGNIATLSTSASVKVKGIILVGGTVAQGVTVGILGAMDGGVAVKLSGTVARGAYLQQAADATAVTDAGSGNARVIIGIANQAGVSGDLIEMFPLLPVSLS